MLDTLDHRSPGTAIAGLVLLIIGAALVAALFLFEPWLRRHPVVNAEFGGWLGLGLHRPGCRFRWPGLAVAAGQNGLRGGGPSRIRSAGVGRNAHRMKKSEEKTAM